MKKLSLLFTTSLISAALLAQPRLNENNIDAVLADMTLEEKATLCVGSGWGSLVAGSMTASDDFLVPGASGTTRAIPRLGIPELFMLIAFIFHIKTMYILLLSQPDLY